VCVCVCVCVCVSVGTRGCWHIHVCVHVHMCACRFAIIVNFSVSIHTNMYVHMRVPVCASVRISVFVTEYIYIYIYIYVSFFLYTYIYMYVLFTIYINIHVYMYMIYLVLGARLGMADHEDIRLGLTRIVHRLLTRTPCAHRGEARQGRARACIICTRVYHYREQCLCLCSGNEDILPIDGSWVYECVLGTCVRACVLRGVRTCVQDFARVRGCAL